jgi:amidase
MDILRSDALVLSSMLARRELGTVELMQATLARIDAMNGAVNAIVSLRDHDQLLAEARQADQTTAKGWLHGIPIAIKDLANVKGLPTSMGSPLFAGQIAEADDLIVARLRAAGAIIIGKTNTPEFGLGSHTFNPVHGVTRNPYDLTRSAGGSSGGAAVALATGMLSVADGSDMMGSLRNPAGWNNVYGMRPGWGTVPAEPVGEMFLHQLATSGPMARSPRDLAALFDTMSGTDARQPHGVSSPHALPLLDEVPMQRRIAWPGDWGGALPFEPGLLELCAVALEQIESMGHEIEAISPPFDMETMWHSWIDLRSFSVTCSLQAIYGDEAKRIHLKPAAIWEVERGLAMSAMQVQAASIIRSDWFRQAHALFERFDVLALPSAQMWPFEADIVHPEKLAGVHMDTYHRWMQVVIPASLIGLPVVNIPVGFGNAGLPAGLQLIGARGNDAQLLQLAEHWHQATHWPEKSPPALQEKGSSGRSNLR